jgi:hypothetical protein
MYIPFPLEFGYQAGSENEEFRVGILLCLKFV